MPYTVLTTWAAGDVILAADVQGEIDSARQYLRHIPSSDIDTDWVDTEHIMRGTFDPFTNHAEFVTGDFIGVNSEPLGLQTYGSTYNTLRLGDAIYAYLPGTGLTLTVRRPCTIMLSWYLTGAVYENQSAGDRGEVDVRLYIGTPETVYGDAGFLWEELEVDANRLTYRQFPSGFHIIDIATPGTYKFGLACSSTTSKMKGLNWGLSIEAFAM